MLEFNKDATAIANFVFQKTKISEVLKFLRFFVEEVIESRDDDFDGVYHLNDFVDEYLLDPLTPLIGETEISYLNQFMFQGVQTGAKLSIHNLERFDVEFIMQIDDPNRSGQQFHILAKAEFPNIEDENYILNAYIEPKQIDHEVVGAALTWITLRY